VLAHPRLRPALAIGVLIVGVAITQGMTRFAPAWFGVARDVASDGLDSEWGGLELGVLIGGALWSAWILVPFVPVAAAIMEEGPSSIAVVLSFFVAVGGTIALILTERHPWSGPLLVALAVGAVFGIDYLIAGD
jgi:hypothetical protein